MRITVIGSGYVGLVTGACLADVGHEVTCVDKDSDKVARLRQGIVDIHEPGLPELIQHGLQEGRLTFTTEISGAVQASQAVFIAVATPAQGNGAADLSQVLAVAEATGYAIERYTVVICKSTVPVGTCQRVGERIRQCLLWRDGEVNIDVVSNPEFLKEGSAIADFMRPHRVVIGSNSEKAIAVMRAIYAPFIRKQERLMVMDIASSEMTKYVANAMLATKISFINEMSRVAEKAGADIEHIRKGIGSDPRIGYDFIYAGCGYGGSCFPKDIQSIIHTGQSYGCDMPLLQAVETVNRQQRDVMLHHLHRHFSGHLSGKTVALWGLAFKPDTDDIREAPSLHIIERLLAQGVRVQAYDPVAIPSVQRHFGQRDHLAYAATRDAALVGADALLICTEWKIFRVLDSTALHRMMRRPVIVDGRNIYDPAQMQREGITYYGIGRGASLAQPAPSNYCQPALAREAGFLPERIHQ